MNLALEDLPIVKLHLALSALTFALVVLALVRPKGSLGHRQAGFLGLGLGGACALAALMWTLPTETTLPGLAVVLALYLGFAGRAWARPDGPTRLERAVTGAALVGGLAMVATGLWVLAGFEAETVTRDKAPLVIAIGLVATLIARWNVLAFAREVAPAERQRAHGSHMVAATGALAIAFTYTLAPRFGAPSEVAAAIATIITAVLTYILPRRARLPGGG